MAWRGVAIEYGLVQPEAAVTMAEGNTPLVPAPGLSSRSGLRVFLKLEGCNPTGSFKDRGMTVAVSRARARGARSVICASTGNTSASAAAYAARGGLRCFVLIPHGSVALGKLAQAMVYGAHVLAVRGNFDDALRLVRELASRRHELAVVNSINPDRIEGQKTAAWEICDQLGRAPDYLCIPVGNAGNITAYWRGFKDWLERGKISSLPVMAGFQAEGAAPIVRGQPIKNPETVATAIRIGNPASWQGALAAVRESGGLVETVSDDEILEAYSLLAMEEGIFVEPASAASVAGLLKMACRGYFREGATVACVLTGNGLKDPDLAVRRGTKPMEVEPDASYIERKVLS